RTPGLRRNFQPILAVPFPGIGERLVEAPASKQEDPLVVRVVGHRMTAARRWTWKRGNDVHPARAVPLPGIRLNPGAARAAKEHRPPADAVVRHCMSES